MDLHIRDPRTHALAKQLADRRGVSMTKAVIDALQTELDRLSPEKSLAERIKPIVDRLAAKAGPTAAT